jgi:hypothetical protein
MAKRMLLKVSLIMATLLAAAMGAVQARPISLTDTGPDTTLASLDLLERGEWELRPRNAAGASPQRLCVSDPRVLLQPRHAGQSCKRFIIDDGVRHVAAAYSCPDGGNGRTDIKFETARLVQIDTQGVDDGMPFSLMIEARKVGQCTGKVTGR